MAEQPTCEERIAEHRDARLAYFRDLLAVVQSHEDDLEGHEVAERLYEVGELDSPKTNTGDELRETAQERLWEMPLGVSTSTVFRIELSTGGPADWLEVLCSGGGLHDEPSRLTADLRREPFEINRIVYHYADWFDHAEDTLTGDDFETAADFARSVVPELVE